MNRLLGAMLAVLVMLVLKDFYSRAGADDLTWMLAPTARIVSRLTSANLVWESGVGYTDFNRGIIIAPACAGINFLIMTFGLAAFCGIRRIRHLPQLLAFLSFCLFGAYGAAQAVNALRIILSMALYQWDIYTSWLTPARVHRLAGTGLYLSALGLFFTGLRPIIHAFCKCFDHSERTVGTRWPFWLPFAWYLLGAVGVPLANLTFHRPLQGFFEHCATVVLFVVIAWSVKWLWRKQSDFSRTRSRT
jgi:exosortase K